MRSFVAAALLVAGMSVGAQAQNATAAAPQNQDLSEMLKQPTYRAAWDKMLRGQKVPGWLTAFAKTGNGVVVPPVLIEIDGVNYQADHVCKPHDCDGNEFEVLFAPDGRQAWGALVANGKKPRFFGAPNPKQKQALQDQLQS